MNQNYYPAGMYPAGANELEGTDPPIENFIDGFPNLSGNSSNLNNNNNNDPHYAENILEKNVGKKITVYMSYSDSIEWRDKAFTGIIEEAGRDYLLLKDENSTKRWLLWTVYLNYAEFPDKVNY